MKEKIVEMLGAGVTPVQVALACGVTEGYISQLLSDPVVEEQVKSLRVHKAAAYVEHDAALDTDEEAARKIVRRHIDNNFLKPMEALKYFQVLNAARRKSDSHGNTQVPTSTVVQLNLPPAAAVQFKLTVDKQVIEIDGRSMTTMPAQQVTKMLREKKAQEHLQAALDTPKMTINTPSLLEQL
jgi:hypothetical protein